MAEQPETTNQKNHTGFGQDFRRFFFRGLALVLPPILTVWILHQLWVFLDSNVAQPVNKWARYGLAEVIAESRAKLPTDNKEEWTWLEPRGPYVRTHVIRAIANKIPSNEMPKKVVDLYERFIYFEYYKEWELTFRIIGLFVAAGVVYFIGHILATFIGRSIWHATEHTVFRLPIVRAVYPYIKQFIDVLLSERKREFNRVVVVEYPRRGIWSLGLVTGGGLSQVQQVTGQELLTVFIPYTPYSVTGYVITVPRSEVMDLNVTVDQAIRFVVSGGVIRPDGVPAALRPGALISAQEISSMEAIGAVHQRPAETQAARLIRVGTRGSQLARAQAEFIAARLRELVPGFDIELIEIRTSGDRAADTRLREISGEGVFTKEIQHALLASEIDVAVHSLKDLPTADVHRLTLAAIPRRAPALDVLVSPRFGDWRSLPPGARIGTSSPRRRSQLMRLRNDFVIEEIRGNVPTRLRKIEEMALAAIVLAEAGLYRLGLEKHITYRFTPDEMLPAPGQGALGIECRADDRELLMLLGQLDDPPTRQAVTAERAVLAALSGGCHMPMGSYATTSGGQLGLRASVFSSDGSRVLSDSLAGPADQAESLGRELAKRLLAAGAAELA